MGNHLYYEVENLLSESIPPKLNIRMNDNELSKLKDFLMVTKRNIDRRNLKFGQMPVSFKNFAARTDLGKMVDVVKKSYKNKPEYNYAVKSFQKLTTNKFLMYGLLGTALLESEASGESMQKTVQQMMIKAKKYKVSAGTVELAIAGMIIAGIWIMVMAPIATPSIAIAFAVLGLLVYFTKQEMGPSGNAEKGKKGSKGGKSSGGKSGGSGTTSEPDDDAGII